MIIHVPALATGQSVRWMEFSGGTGWPKCQPLAIDGRTGIESFGPIPSAFGGGVGDAVCRRTPLLREQSLDTIVVKKRLEVRLVLDRCGNVRVLLVCAAQLPNSYIYPHQANYRILELIARKLGVPMERVYTAGIAKYGNTSAASIPIGYCDTRGRYNRERLEIDVAFGAGFASGAILRRGSPHRSEAWTRT